MASSVTSESSKHSGNYERFTFQKGFGRSSLPSALRGWPVQLDSPLVWNGEQLKTTGSFTYTLNEAEREEINSALEFFLTLGLDGSEVNSSNFPLPMLGARLRRFSLEVHEGRGFIVVCGLDRSRYSVEDNVINLLGISSYIGAKRGMQDDDGFMLGHIRQANLTKASQENRPLRDSNLKAYFHTDLSSDILAMQAVSSASSGGSVLLASAGIIYNELADTRPDILEVLTRPNWAFDLRGRHYQDQPRPLLYFHDGQVILNFNREPLLGVAGVTRADGIPAATPEQMEALDVIEALAKKHQLALSLDPGDLLFVNNLAVLHSREKFQDSPTEHRYLIRLWLRNEELAWKLPRPLELSNQVTFYDGEVQEIWNVAAHPRIKFSDLERFSP